MILKYNHRGAASGRQAGHRTGARGGSPVWLFDLDNTLHHASHAIFDRIHVAMTDYVSAALGVSRDEADRIRDDYWRRYGATLLGMVRHHGVDPDHFLAEVHRFDDIGALLRAERGLGRRLAALPGRKVLLTNGPADYAREIAGHLRLQARFAHAVAIEQMWVHRRLRPKPDTLMLRRLLARLGIAPHRAVLVEDTLGHLRRYRRLGLRTVWMAGWSGARARGRKPAYVDLKVRSIAELARRFPL